MAPATTRWCGQHWHTLAKTAVVLAVMAAAATITLSPISSAAAGPPGFIGPAGSACKLTKLTYSPSLLAVGQDDTVYIDEYVQEILGPKVPVGVAPCIHPSHMIVKRTRDGSTSVIAGEIGNQGTPTPGRATASPYEPGPAAVDLHGNLYVVEDSAVLKITPRGRQSVVAGELGKAGRPTPGKATHSRLTGGFLPSGIAVDANNNLYIADGGNDVVEKVTPQGQLSILAGEIRRTGPPIPGPASRSTLFSPVAVAVDQAGDAYIGSGVGKGQEYVSEITPQGNLSVVAGDGSFGAPKQGAQAVNSPLGVIWGIAIRSGRLFIATGGDIFAAFNVLVELNASGTLTRISDSVYGKHTSGPDSCGRVNASLGVSFDSAGNAFINGGTCGVVEVTPQGKLSVLARTYTK